MSEVSLNILHKSCGPSGHTHTTVLATDEQKGACNESRCVTRSTASESEENFSITVFDQNACYSLKPITTTKST